MHRDHRVRPDPRQHPFLAQNHLFHVVLVPDTDPYEIRAAPPLEQTGKISAAGERLQRWGAARPQGELVATVDHQIDNVRTHVSHADKANIHDSQPRPPRPRGTQTRRPQQRSIVGTM